MRQHWPLLLVFGVLGAILAFTVASQNGIVLAVSGIGAVLYGLRTIRIQSVTRGCRISR